MSIHNKMIYSKSENFTMEYYSAVKKNSFEYTVMFKRNTC